MRLKQFPQLGGMVPEIENLKIREILVGDYRIIYRFDVAKGEIYLVAIGHRREIYRD